MRLALAALTMLVACPVAAHDRWANGEPVPAWVKAWCCGPEDVHHLRPDQVHLRADGYHIDGYPDVIPVDKATPSQDGEYWAFYAIRGTADAPSYSTIYCFFAPPMGS